MRDKNIKYNVSPSREWLKKMAEAEDRMEKEMKTDGIFSSRERRAFMRLPVEQRREILEKQAQDLAKHYNENNEWKEIDGYEKEIKKSGDCLKTVNLLLAEKTTLERMLANLPESSVIDRMSLEARKAEVEKELSSNTLQLKGYKKMNDERFDSKLNEVYFTYHEPTKDQIPKYEELRKAGKQFADALIRLCPESADRTRAINKVRDAVMWGNAAIATHQASMEIGKEEKRDDGN